MLRHLNDGEIGEYEELLSILSLVTLDGIIDNSDWRLTTNWSFTVKFFYKQLFKHEDHGFIFPFRQTWKARVPPRVLFIAWEASSKGIMTINKLWRQGKILLNTRYLCMRAKEICNYVLLRCHVVYKL